MNWLQYIEDDPTDLTKPLTFGSGHRGKANYVSEGGVFRRRGDKSDWITVVLPAGAQPLRYEQHLTDGGVLVYGHADSVVNGRRKIFLTEVIDRFGLKATLTWGFNRLTKITDAAGKHMTLQYSDAAGANPWLIRSITDPFGRQVQLQYNAAGELSSLTDPAGFASAFTYEPSSNNQITSFSTPYGTTLLSLSAVVDQVFDYPSQQMVNIVRQRTLQITDPENRTRTVRWQEWTDPATMPQGEPLPAGFDDSSLHLNNTFYWTTQALTGGALIQNAHIFHWLIEPQTGKRQRVLSSWKKPLQHRTWYRYHGQANPDFIGLKSWPSKVVHKRADGSEEISMQEYDDLGHLTMTRTPSGREHNFNYSVDKIALESIDLVANGGVYRLQTRVNNVRQLPDWITDASGQVTGFTYNSRWQRATITNPKGEVLKLEYENTATLPEYGKLKKVTRAFGTPLAADTIYGYDSQGRVATVTDSDGDTITLLYDAIGGNPLATLDRVTRVEFPDGTNKRVEWNKFDVQDYFDRAGKKTHYEYNDNRQLVQMTDPANRTVNMVAGNCCGSIDTLEDAAGNKTHWSYNIDGSVYQKKIGFNTPAERTVATHVYAPDDGELESVTDALGQTKTFGHNEDHQITSIQYSNLAAGTAPTADLSLTYDPITGWLETMTDGTGTCNYTYHPIDATDGILGDGQLAKVEFTPGGAAQPDWTQNYTYDELGRVKTGPTRSDAQWDALGRTTTLVNGLGSFSYSYFGFSGRVNTVTGPNGFTTTHGYKDALHDRRLETITHKFGSTTLSTHGYSYDVTGRITEWLQWHNGLTGAGSQFGFGYDGADQLTSAVQRETATGSLENLFNYHYDDAGNRTLAQEGGIVRSWTANGYNQLTARAAGGEMEVRGTVNTPSTVEVNGQPALMTGPEWSAKLTVQAGENIFPIKATEAEVDPGLNAQITEQHLRITVPAGSATLSYDANGNLLNDGVRTFQWDAENRLAKVSGPRGVTEFGYDGFDRRVRVVEKQGATVVSDKHLVWEGLSIVEERDSANTVTKRFFGMGEQRVTMVNSQPATLDLLYTTDHLGSIRELVDTSGAVRARYDYGLYGRRTKVSGNLDADFGFTGHYTHTPSSLVLAPFRAYDPELGRWLSRDPIEEEGGVNLYGYAYGNPIAFIDTDGLDPQPVARTGQDRHVSNPDNTVRPGEAVRHPGRPYDNQCAAGAQHETGTRINDAPNANTWRQGPAIGRNTPIGTLIATGWQNGRYPNQNAGNHTCKYLGTNRDGTIRVREQYRREDGTGTPMHEASRPATGYREVRTPTGTQGPPHQGGGQAPLR